MDKFSITRLESARRDPFAFGKELKNGKSSESGFGGYPKSMRWLNAICKYHENNDISSAILSLERGFSNRQDTSRNRNELENFVNALNNYEKEFKKRKYSLIKSREPVNLILTDILRITGQISIIFMKPTTGFTAYFITRENIGWQSELKYPVIQKYIADEIFSCEVADVDIGYINYYSGDFFQASFSNNEIKSAMRELKKIGDDISSALR